jgi:hypothetical protein
MRRVMSDFLLSACALSVILVMLMAFDQRVRDEVRLRLNAPARASSDIAAVGGQARSLLAVLVESAKSQTQDHGPLVVMVVAGMVLTLFMVRT